MNSFTYSDLPIVYLSPAEIYFSQDPAVITTILGSCVSICLYTNNPKAGAMCHCLLPSASDKNTDQPFRYVDQTIPYMVLKMREMKITCDKINAKLFGGADMFKDSSLSKPSVGKQNIEAAKIMLTHYNIPIEKENVGGHTGIKIFFNTATGEVFLRKLSSTSKIRSVQYE